MTPSEGFFLAFLTAILTSIVAPLVTGWLARRRTDAEADVGNAEAMQKIVAGGGEAVETAIKLLEKYERQNNELQNQIDDLRKQLKKLTEKVEVSRKHIDYLEATLQKNNIEFAPRPNELLDTGDRITKATS